MKLWRRRRAALVSTAVAAGAALAWWLPVAAWAAARADWLRGLGVPGMALFVAIYVGGEVLLVPGSLLTLSAGFVYGAIGGMFVAVPASVLAATVSFVLARTTLRTWLRTRVQQHPTLRALDTAVSRNSFMLILLLRLSPAIPFNLLNYALGLSQTRVGLYMAASLLGMLPGTWLYVYIGSLATSGLHLASDASAVAPHQTLFTAVGAVATLAAVALVTRAARRALAEELSASA